MHDNEVIAAHWPIFSGINGTRCACGWRESMPIADLSDHAAKIWAAHVQAELVRASTVTTEAELRELPEGSIIRDGKGRAWTRRPEGTDFEGHVWSRDGYILRAVAVTLPARVLHRPV